MEYSSEAMVLAYTHGEGHLMVTLRAVQLVVLEGLDVYNLDHGVACDP